jgi:hypothetical protein
MFLEGPNDDFLKSKHVVLHRINVFTFSCVRRTYANTQVVYNTTEWNQLSNCCAAEVCGLKSSARHVRVTGG